MLKNSRKNLKKISKQISILSIKNLVKLDNLIETKNDIKA